MKREVRVLDVLFPKVRSTMLRLLFCTPPDQRYVRELMKLSGLALCTVQDELRKLMAIGVVTTWSNGYKRYYQANAAHPLAADLLRIVQKSAHLPATKHALLHRRSSPSAGKHQRSRQGKSLPVDRPTRWNLFPRRRVRQT